MLHNFQLWVIVLGLICIAFVNEGDCRVRAKTHRVRSKTHRVHYSGSSDGIGGGGGNTSNSSESGVAVILAIAFGSTIVFVLVFVAFCYCILYFLQERWGKNETNQADMSARCKNAIPDELRHNHQQQRLHKQQQLIPLSFNSVSVVTEEKDIKKWKADTNENATLAEDDRTRKNERRTSQVIGSVALGYTDFFFSFLSFFLSSFLSFFLSFFLVTLSVVIFTAIALWLKGRADAKHRSP